MRFLVFGDPEELEAYRDVIAAYGEHEPEADVQLVEASDRERSARAALDLVRRRDAARPLPHQLPLLRPVRGQGRARAARRARRGLGRVRARRLLSPGDRGVPLARSSSRACRRTSRASSCTTTATCSAHDVPEPQAGWTWDGWSTRQRADARRNGAPSEPDRAGGRLESAVYGLGVEPASSGSPRSCGRAAASSSTTSDADALHPRTTAGARRRSSNSSTCAACIGDARPTGSRGGGRRGAVRQRAAGDAALLAPRRPRRSARSRTSTGTWRRCPCCASRPASCTRMRTAWPPNRDGRTRPGASSSSPSGPRGSASWRETGRTVPSLIAVVAIARRSSIRRRAEERAGRSWTASRRSAACRRSRRGRRSRMPSSPILENEAFELGTRPPRSRGRSTRRRDRSSPAPRHP